jgi:hypothetical protein
MPPVDRNNPIGGVGTSSQLLAAVTPTSTIITRLTNREQGFWAKYREHVKRRHYVVHRGGQVDADAAESSIVTTSAFFDYVEV